MDMHAGKNKTCSAVHRVHTWPKAVVPPLSSASAPYFVCLWRLVWRLDVEDKPCEFFSADFYYSISHSKYIT